MESEAIDPADFRDAQHRNWDSVAVEWMGRVKPARNR